MTKQWHKTYTEGTYVSANGLFRAELRKPGTYDGTKLVRHYAVYHGGSSQLLGTAITLADAYDRYVR